MNDRIKELAEKALMSSMVHNEMYRPKGYAHAVSKQFVDKFAELIVRECADLTRWQEYDMSVEQRIRLEIYQEIKKHFGVEE